MISLDTSLKSLQVCLAAVPPVELKSMALLRQSQIQAGRVLPPGLDRDAVREATVEVIAYTTRCAALLQRLNNLPPTPLTTITFPGFHL